MFKLLPAPPPRGACRAASRPLYPSWRDPAAGRRLRANADAHALSFRSGALRRRLRSCPVPELCTLVAGPNAPPSSALRAKRRTTQVGDGQREQNGAHGALRGCITREPSVFRGLSMSRGCITRELLSKAAASSRAHLARVARGAGRGNGRWRFLEPAMAVRRALAQGRSATLPFCYHTASRPHSPRKRTRRGRRKDAPMASRFPSRALALGAAISLGIACGAPAQAAFASESALALPLDPPAIVAPALSDRATAADEAVANLEQVRPRGRARRGARGGAGGRAARQAPRLRPAPSSPPSATSRPAATPSAAPPTRAPTATRSSPARRTATARTAAAAARGPAGAAATRRSARSAPTRRCCARPTTRSPPTAPR